MFNIPNLFTAANMLCGVLAIILALAGRIDIAPFLIFLGAILDFFDGFLARLLKQQGELGKQLDSLADMITFGLAPGIIMFVILLMYDNNINVLNESTAMLNLSMNSYLNGLVNLDLSNKLPFVALIIPFFSMFRLAKFNIDTRQSESFIGLPTPANTIFFMAFPLLLVQYGDTVGWEHDLIIWIIQPMILIPIIVVMSVLLVSELPLFALKFKYFKWQGNEIRYIFLISCGLLIAFLWTWSIAIIVLLYLLLSFIQHILRKKSNV
jgi:CDP-diacylglycerol--serine O-phosphatidyltransferase